MLKLKTVVVKSNDRLLTCRVFIDECRKKYGASSVGGSPASGPLSEDPRSSDMSKL